ncbi:ribosome assembly cofactor RimP [Sphingobacterium spiritivorum]|uniref:ribosome assembly cofactor RimP n=1 Tax=Sphingobacterium spiritivorum TaxID=258 RepID=UPI003DA4231A
MKTKVEQRVEELVLEKIGDREDLFIVSIKMQGNGVLEILVDGDSGIAIDDCVKISRHVGFHLEEENVIETAYRLEVSSPGIDSPLVLIRQYEKNIGRNVRVKNHEGEKREGKLLNVTENDITIEESKKEKGKKAVPVESVIPFEQIKETKVLISFK